MGDRIKYFSLNQLLNNITERVSSPFYEVIMRKKYMCHGGYVYSNDGDRHYVSSYQLPFLYAVPRDKCICLTDEIETLGYNVDEYIHLYPQSNGDYTIPE